MPITLEKINIKKADLIRILERHGDQMSFKEFLNLFSSIQSPDLITQSRRLEEDRLLIFKKINGGKHYTEMGIIKKDNGYVIHFMKTRKRSVNSLLKKVITFYKSDDL